MVPTLAIASLSMSPVDLDMSTIVVVRAIAVLVRLWVFRIWRSCRVVVGVDVVCVIR